MYARFDVPDVHFLGSTFSLCEIPPWHDEQYQFSLPASLVSKLQLGPDMCNFYGDVGLLPKTKRSGVQNWGGHTVGQDPT